MRSVTSSIGPRPSTLTSDAPAVVDVDERLGLLAVDLEAMPHDGLVVVGATLFERTLAQSLDDDVGVGDQLDDGIERLIAAGEELVELATWSVVRG